MTVSPNVAEDLASEFFPLVSTKTFSFLTTECSELIFVSVQFYVQVALCVKWMGPSEDIFDLSSTKL
jgi:hypothetical protein